MIDYEVSNGVCLLRLNSPPLNILTLPVLAELRSCMGRANADCDVRAIVIGGDEQRFSAGGDINLFETVAGPADAVELSRVFQEAFDEVEDSSKPVSAALAGPVMGAAVELAAACHVRVCTAATTFTMPEVNFGINPGAGGTQRLPRLVGLWPALRMLLTAQTVGSQEALEIGLVDAVCSEAGLIARASELASAIQQPVRTRDRSEKTRDRQSREAELKKSDELMEKIRPELIAPRKIVEAVRVGLEESFRAGLLSERRVLVQCMETAATKNKFHVHFAIRRAGKAEGLSDLETRPIGKAAVVGVGAMGTGIAQALVQAGLPVAVYDIDPAAAARGVHRIEKSMRKRVEQGKLTENQAAEMLRLISNIPDLPGVGDADLVIEAVVEDLTVKQSVIRRIEEACGEQAVIASNTSTISLDQLAAAMRRGERLIGMHFFNPAHRMPLVEIIRRDETPGPVLAAAMQLAKKMRKTPVLVRSREGFLVNRIFIPYVKEAFYLLEEGAGAAEIDAAMVEFGFPMGPLAVMDMAGLDILVLADAVMSRAFPSHGVVSPIARRLVEQRRLGQKTGGGVYDYEPGDHTPRRSAAAQEIIEGVRREIGAAPRAFSAGGIVRRLVLRMAAEAFLAVQEGVPQRQSDVDAATVLGIGFPDFRGGVLRHARELGIDKVIDDLHELAGECGQRYRPCTLLHEMKGAEPCQRTSNARNLGPPSS